MIGSIIGTRIRNSVRQKPAPSTAAASGMSLGMAVRPASRITVRKWNDGAKLVYQQHGGDREVWFAELTSGALNGLYTCVATSTQLITL